MLTWIVAVVVRGLAATWRVERPPWPVPGPCVVAIWHGDQLPMLALHQGMGMVPLTSWSADGEFLTRVLARLGYEVIRGSSSRGGLLALRSARRLIEAGGRPVFAVDGPRGPARIAKPGAATLARHTGVPLVTGTVVARGWRAPSWDGLLVPWPFARVVVRYEVSTGGVRGREPDSSGDGA